MTEFNEIEAQVTTRCLREVVAREARAAGWRGKPPYVEVILDLDQGKYVVKMASSEDSKDVVTIATAPAIDTPENVRWTVVGARGRRPWTYGGLVREVRATAKGLAALWVEGHR